MVNLRYHIVSITAVFLALGIGLTLGSTFLDRVTVDNLNRQLTDVSGQVSQTREEIEDLRGQVGRSAERDAELAAELPEQLLRDRLTGLPLLLVATRGSDENLVTATRDALAGAGADVAGTWWITDRWELDDESEVEDLGRVLGLSTSDQDRLRRNAAIRLAGLLSAASQPAPAPEGDAEPVQPAPAEPELVAALVQAGFLDYEAVPGAGDARVLLPGAGARYVVVSGGPPATGQQVLALGLAEETAAEGPVAMVAAQGLTDLPDDGRGAPPSEDARRVSFVGLLRSNEVTQTRVSTIDDLDLAAGRAALVLALEGLGVGQVGHYGVASGANRLLPAPVAP